MFTKEERSSFPYWFAHWCAFQMTALNHHMWKFRYLFHDIEKPWLKLFLSYEDVQKWHRTHNSHHPEWLEKKLNSIVLDPQSDPDHYMALSYIDFFDYEAMIIDWECSRFTKEASPKTAREELSGFFTLKNASTYPVLLMNDKWRNIFKENCYKVLDKYGF